MTEQIAVRLTSLNDVNDLMTSPGAGAARHCTKMQQQATMPSVTNRRPATFILHIRDIL